MVEGFGVWFLPIFRFVNITLFQDLLILRCAQRLPTGSLLLKNSSIPPNSEATIAWQPVVKVTSQKTADSASIPSE
jgi:hypothetical protein